MGLKADSETKANSGSCVDRQLVQVMSHRVRVQALTVLTERTASPKELGEELGVSLNSISHHVQALLKMGLIELVEEHPRRGSVEHFYRSVMRPLLRDEEWEQLNLVERKQFSMWIVQLVMTDIAKSMAAGTFDDRFDRYAARVPMVVDLQGWRDLNAINDRALDETLEVQAESAERLAASGEEAIHVSASLLCFEMPPVRRGRR